MPPNTVSRISLLRGIALHISARHLDQVQALVTSTPRNSFEPGVVVFCRHCSVSEQRGPVKVIRGGAYHLLHTR